ncbi:hypothetical protein HY631_04900 [Candidatus Uhrbacteria bacterium]|nr:hypothetical protein [Candidatus Uhrbacteria bacterium]
MEGICCECQNTHPVHYGHTDTEDDLDSLMADEVFDWVMDSHDAYGSHCSGSCTTPQALIKEKA